MRPASNQATTSVFRRRLGAGTLLWVEVDVATVEVPIRRSFSAETVVSDHPAIVEAGPRRLVQCIGNVLFAQSCTTDRSILDERYLIT